MSAAPSLAGRAAAAVLLMVGFYGLALTIVGVLVAIPVAEVVYARRLEPRIAFFCLVGAFAVLRGIIPRRDRFEPPGPELTRDQHPRLFAMVEEVARATQQPMPAQVYLVPEVTAWVAQRGGVMGFGSHRVMGLGLPLLAALSVDELRAVIAHEFGHYHGGDVALGPWIYKTRAAIARTLESLARYFSPLIKPFTWYGLGFLRITHAISRRQEFAADALAARVVGAAPLATGLRTIHGIAGAFAPYWFREVVPVLQHGFRPPIAAGFTQFLAAQSVAPTISAAIAEGMSPGKVDPYDTHPPLRDRVAALGALNAAAIPEASDEGPRAITLLEGVDELEARLVASVSEDKAAEPVAAISWAEAGPRVWPAIWRDRLDAEGARLAGITPAHIPGLLADLPEAAARLRYAPNRLAAEDGQWNRNVLSLLWSALGVALVDRGWTVSAPPGGSTVFSRDGESITPLVDLTALANGEMQAAEWEAMWRKLGLLDLDLGTLRAGAVSTLRAAAQGLTARAQARSD
jgi:Zn-dependent protease with chaperone function